MYNTHLMICWLFEESVTGAQKEELPEGGERQTEWEKVTFELGFRGHKQSKQTYPQP